LMTVLAMICLPPEANRCAATIPAHSSPLAENMM
jgi:hypothetical protein